MSDYSKMAERRLKCLGGLFVLIAFVIIWRLVNLQLFQHDHYIALAQGQQRFDKVQLAHRGKIFVHDSAVDLQSYYPMAFDVKSFDVWVVPRQVKKKEDTAKALASVLNLSEVEIFGQINNDKLYIPPVKKHLSADEANVVKEKDITGVFVMPEYSRYYPEAMLASQVIGFVNADGDGVYGFEGMYDNELKGTAGNVTGERDTLGRVISLLQQNDPKDGTSFVLTLDRSAQYYVEKKLNEAITQYQADSGSVIIMDIKTGGIVAMASSPSYDPNNFRDFAKTNPGIFVNPAISNLYEPGSIFKPIIMSSALDKGVINPDTTETFDWHTFVDGYEIKTAELKAFGLENMMQILQHSDNVGMVWVSEQLGKEDMYKYIKAYHFFDKTGIDLRGEALGYAPSLKSWKDINRATISFGQGISVSPIELVSAYAAIANNGVYIKPHIVDKIIASDGSEKSVEKQELGRVIKEETAKEIQNMLTQVVDLGSSYSKVRVPGYTIAAKTGTAQIANPDGRGYLSSEDGLGIYTHSVAGFAPADSPRYAMLVKLDKPKTARYAESTAAPLFGDISNYLLNYYYRIAPER